MTMENLTGIDNKRTNISFLELKFESWIIPPLTMPDTKGHLSSQQLHLGLASVHHKSAGGHAGNGQAGQIQGAHGWLAAGGSPTVLSRLGAAAPDRKVGAAAMVAAVAAAATAMVLDAYQGPMMGHH